MTQESVSRSHFFIHLGVPKILWPFVLRSPLNTPDFHTPSGSEAEDEDDEGAEDAAAADAVDQGGEGGADDDEDDDDDERKKGGRVEIGIGGSGAGGGAKEKEVTWRLVLEKRERKKKQKSGAVGVGMTAGMCKHWLLRISSSKTGSSPIYSHSTPLTKLRRLYFAAPDDVPNSKPRNPPSLVDAHQLLIQTSRLFSVPDSNILFPFQKRTLNTREMAGSSAV